MKQLLCLLMLLAISAPAQNVAKPSDEVYASQYGAPGYNTLTNVLGKIGAHERTLYIDRGSWLMTSTNSIPSNIIVKVAKDSELVLTNGCLLTLDADCVLDGEIRGQGSVIFNGELRCRGYVDITGTLDLSGGFMGLRQQYFGDGYSDLVLDTSSVIYPEWFGSSDIAMLIDGNAQYIELGVGTYTLATVIENATNLMIKGYGPGSVLDVIGSAVLELGDRCILQDLTINLSSDELYPVVSTNAASLTYRNVVFNGTPTNGVQSSITSRLAIENCEFNDIRAFSSKWSTNITVSGCLFDGCGPIVLRGSGWRLRDTEFRNYAEDNFGNYHHFIRCDGATNVVFDGCSFTAGTNAAIDLKNSTANVRIENCRFDTAGATNSTIASVGTDGLAIGDCSFAHGPYVLNIDTDMIMTGPLRFSDTNGLRGARLAGKITPCWQIQNLWPDPVWFMAGMTGRFISDGNATIGRDTSVSRELDASCKINLHVSNEVTKLWIWPWWLSRGLHTTEPFQGGMYAKSSDCDVRFEYSIWPSGVQTSATEYADFEADGTWQLLQPPAVKWNQDAYVLPGTSAAMRVVMQTRDGATNGTVYLADPFLYALPVTSTVAGVEFLYSYVEPESRQLYEWVLWDCPSFQSWIAQGSTNVPLTGAHQSDECSVFVENTDWTYKEITYFDAVVRSNNDVWVSLSSPTGTVVDPPEAYYHVTVDKKLR